MQDAAQTSFEIAKNPFYPTFFNKKIMIENLPRWMNWLINTTRGKTVGELDGVFPPVFDRYYKIYFPFAFAEKFPEDTYPALPDSVEDMNARSAIGRIFFESTNWEKIKTDYLRPIYLKELAQYYQVPFSETLGVQEIYRKLGKKPIQLQRSIDYEVEILNILVDWLGPKKKVKQFDYGNFQLGSLSPDYQKDWIKIIKLSDWPITFRQENELLNQPFPYFSAYLFPAKKDWCIAAGSSLGGHFLLMALNHKSGASLEKLEGLEVVRLKKQY